MIDPELLLQGYRLGVFPMAMADGAIEWFSPDPRAILPLKEFHVPHTVERAVRKGVFEIRIDVSSRAGRVEGGASRTGRASAEPKIYFARHPIAHSALATSRSHRSSPHEI